MAATASGLVLAPEAQAATTTEIQLPEIELTAEEAASLRALPEEQLVALNLGEVLGNGAMRFGIYVLENLVEDRERKQEDDYYDDWDDEDEYYEDDDYYSYEDEYEYDEEEYYDDEDYYEETSYRPRRFAPARLVEAQSPQYAYPLQSPKNVGAPVSGAIMYYYVPVLLPSGAIAYQAIPVATPPGYHPQSAPVYAAPIPQYAAPQPVPTAPAPEGREYKAPNNPLPILEVRRVQN